MPFGLVALAVPLNAAHLVFVFSWTWKPVVYSLIVTLALSSKLAVFAWQLRDMRKIC